MTANLVHILLDKYAFQLYGVGIVSKTCFLNSKSAVSNFYLISYLFVQNVFTIN